MSTIGVVRYVGIATMIATSAAYAADVDWKVYGFASMAGTEVCFYEALGVARMPNGIMRVWTKCLPQKELDAIDIKADFGGRIVDNVARKMLRPYVPPIVTVERSIDFDQATMITTYEEAANVSGIRPHATIFYELNCSQKVMREMSITFDVNGEYGGKDKPGEWRFVPPEGNGANLLKILCRA